MPDTDLERIHVTLQRRNLTRLNHVTFDPVRQRPRHGARSRIINRLLEEWLDRVEREGLSSEDLKEDTANV